MKINLPETPIRFLFNGQPHETEAKYATLTVLEYLRDVLGLTGTKEGCAEGGCGACMVAFAEPGNAEYQAVTSCIKLLGTLNGGSLVTIEHLSSSGNLHPVQSAMADACAAQCGFCTPGMIMSLYVLYETGTELTDNEIHYALAGNLCRCTGYRPILEAGRRLLQKRDGVSSPDDKNAGPSNPVNAYDNTSVSTADFHAPTTMEELTETLIALPGAQLMAGGTNIVPDATKNHHLSSPIIYLGRIQALKSVSLSATHIEIGAAAPLVQVFPVLVSEYPELEEVLRRFASLPIINVATLGGNLANRFPGDLIPVLIALDTSLVLRNSDVTRMINLQDFYTDDHEHQFHEREFIECIHIPRRHSNQHVGAYKIAKRFEQDTSAVLGAFSIFLDGGKVRHAHVSYAGMSKLPGRADNVEAALRGKDWNEETIEQAVVALAKDYSPVSDLRCSADYRFSVASNLLRKFYLEVSSGQTISVWK